MNTSAGRLFVYGTLMRGEVNARWLGEADGDARFVGAARTICAYTMIDLGSFPGLLEGGSVAVEGELYEVSAARFTLLDDFEGVPALFARGLVTLSDGARAEAYLLTGRPPQAPVISSGGWRSRAPR